MEDDKKPHGNVNHEAKKNDFKKPRPGETPKTDAGHRPSAPKK